MDEHALRKKLKRIGVRHWTADDARAVLAAQRASGESIRAFAARLGVRAKRLSWWRSRLGEWSGTRVHAAAFAPAIVQERAALVERMRGAITVRLPTGELVEVGDTSAVKAGWVAALVVGCARRG